MFFLAEKAPMRNAVLPFAVPAAKPPQPAQPAQPSREKRK